MAPSCSKENSIRFTEEILHHNNIETLKQRLRGIVNLHPWQLVLLLAGDHHNPLLT